MAGVDLRTVQELGGWKTLGMVQRYARLAPSHLQAAVERLVPSNAAELARNLLASRSHSSSDTMMYRKFLFFRTRRASLNW